MTQMLDFFRPARTSGPSFPLRLTLAAALALGLGGALDADRAWAKTEIVMEDLWVGANDAPVTIIEYASLTCPACAKFHNGAFGDLVGGYIDNGKVKLIYRDFPLDEMALKAAMLTRCSGDARYFGMLELLFEKQESWAQAEKPLEALTALARVAGMGEQEINACLANTALQDRVLQSRLDAVQKYGVTSTPTFLIGDAKYVGPQSMEQLRAIIDPLLSAAGVEPGEGPIDTAGSEPATSPEPAPAEAELPLSEESDPYGAWILMGVVLVILVIGARVIATRRRK